MAFKTGWWGSGGGRRSRRENPETPITKQVREILRLLRIPHYKSWGGPMSAPGVSDIVGALPPSGRALFIELKVPGKGPRPDQKDFLDMMDGAGALAFVAHGAREVVAELAAAGYEPAGRLSIELGIAAGPKVDDEDEEGKEAP